MQCLPHLHVPRRRNKIERVAGLKLPPLTYYTRMQIAVLLVRRLHGAIVESLLIPILVANKLQFVAEEQQAWRDLAVSTDHDGVAL